MNHLCLGCGICAAICPQERIRMVFSARDGYFIPTAGFEDCEIACGLCERVCPFVPENPGPVDIAGQLFAKIPSIQKDDVLGYYLQTLAGYSTEHRPKSASGGLLTWILETLLRRGEIDGAVCVGPDPKSPLLFDFRICRSVEDIRACSGSCYQPVELSRALRQVLAQDGRYAVVALPCVARGLRLAMRSNDQLQARIHMIFGLVCGQMKSRHFIEYLVHKYAARDYPSRICFRHKRSNHPASDYAYRFVWENRRILDLGWTEDIARPWGERWFTLEACDYCDDVFAECADAAFMDAWLPQYAADLRGHSLLLVRNPLVGKILPRMQDAPLTLEPIDRWAMLASQSGLIHQKRILTAYHGASPHHPKRIPGIRTSRRKRRPDHKLEAWTKARIRVLTRFGILEHSRAGERRIKLLSIPWSMARLLAGLARPIRRRIRNQISRD